MKNFSKNNYSTKRNDTENRRSQSKNNFKKGNDLNTRDDFKRRDGSNRRDDFKRRDNFKRRDDYERKDDIKSNEYSYLKSKEKPRNSFNQSQTRFSSNAQQTEYYSENSSKKFQLSPNERNFEDWIWGKHSVFAALNSERPINRIWCTSEIFSSEKFYLLLKDLKSKGVLVEEVTWSRLSQLTLSLIHI